MPWRRADYPPNWEMLRAGVQRRADDRCETCGVANHAVGARDRHGVWHDEDDIEQMNSSYGMELFSGEYPKIIKIVCTTAHLPGTSRMTTNIGDLRFLCNRCHLNLDRNHHLAVQARNRRTKKGLMPLWPDVR